MGNKDSIICVCPVGRLFSRFVINKESALAGFAFSVSACRVSASSYDAAESFRGVLGMSRMRS